MGHLVITNIVQLSLDSLWQLISFQLPLAKMTPLLQGLNKIYILAARQQQCVHRFYVRLPGSFGWWHLLLQANYGFLLLFWIPTIRIILLLLGFMAKTQEFSLRHGSNIVQKKIVPLSGFYICCLITDTSLNTKWPCKCHFQLWRETSILTFLGITFKFEACKESLSVAIYYCSRVLFWQLIVKSEHAILQHRTFLLWAIKVAAEVFGEI
jgi:hypothetical protein